MGDAEIGFANSSQLAGANSVYRVRLLVCVFDALRALIFEAGEAQVCDGDSEGAELTVHEVNYYDSE